MHAGALLTAYRERYGALQVGGMGGPALREFGFDEQVGLEEMTITGIVEVIAHLPTIFRASRRLKRWVKAHRPRLAILVDFPDFNFHLAKFLKRQGIPILYFISPQVWAWRRGRIKTIRRLVDHMLVLFPFEERLYHEHDVAVSYSGHPLVDRFYHFCERRGSEIVPSEPPRSGAPFPIALMPGSRWSEVRRILPVMLESLQGLRELVPDAEFVLIRAASLGRQRLEQMLGASPVQVAVRDDSTFDALADVKFALVASGTATLEVALFGRPMIIGYRTSWLSYLLGRLLIKVDHIGMVNILARARIVPELIQRMFNPQRIVDAARTLLDSSRYRETVLRLRSATEVLGDPGVGERQAKVVARLLDEFD